MNKIRVIPCLLLKNKGLVKTKQFKDSIYVGDPINAVKIFNDKEADELLFIDIEASKLGRGPDYELLSRIVKEAFMPFGYGGGVKTLDDITKLLHLGIEKVCINSFAIKDIEFVKKASDLVGSQSIVISIDVKKDFFGKFKVYDYLKQKTTNLDPVEFAKQVELKGAGEILLMSVDKEGKFEGYNLELISKVSKAVNIPVVALGGASEVNDFKEAINAGTSAVSAGSLFVFYGPNKAVLINYPIQKNFLREQNE